MAFRFGRNGATRVARPRASSRRLCVEPLETRAYLTAGLAGYLASDAPAGPAAIESVAATSQTAAGPVSTELPFGPEYESTRPCGTLQCLVVPKLLGAAMRADGTVRLVGSSANHNPSQLTVTDINARGETVRQFGLPQTLHVNPFSGIGGAISISPNGRWIAVGRAVYDMDAAGEPQIIATGDAFPIGAESIVRVADDGRAIVTWNGKSFLWDAANGLRPLDSLFLNDPKADPLQVSLGVYANAISASGSIVVGNSGGNGDYGHATYWDASGPHALEDFGRASDAWAVSADGRIIGGAIRGAGAVVWIDGRLTVVRDAHGNPLSGTVTSIVTGIDGGPDEWLALGVSEGEHFIAFGDGMARPLRNWLKQEHSIEVTDDAVMGPFHHDGSLSLITVQHDQISCFPDPIDCAQIPRTQRAIHLSVVPLSETGDEEGPATAGPFSAIIPPTGAYVNQPGALTPTADGFQTIGFEGGETVVNQFDRTGQLIRKIHFTPPTGRTMSLGQFSDDGLWVKGMASTPTDAVAVYWRLSHPDQPLTEEQLAPASRPVFSPLDQSADGRVTIVKGTGSTWSTLAVRVDGEVREIRDASGATLVGQIDRLFTGIGGVATRWIAVGQYSAPGGYGERFIAFSDGTLRRLWEFVQEQSGEDNDFYFYPHYSNLAIGNGSILFVGETYTSPPCSPQGACGNVIIPTGYAVTSVPLPDKWVRSPLDLDRNDRITAADALIVINYLTEHGAGTSVTGLGTHLTYDINDDGRVTASDALFVINWLNSPEGAASLVSDLAREGGEGEASPGDWAHADYLAIAADAYFESLQPGRRRMGR